MREILFRGKEAFNDNWVYGSLIRRANYYSIFKEDFTINKDQTITFDEKEKPIQINTLGQFTGLIDKNGKEIFEGDIIIGDIPELLGSQNLIGAVEYEKSAFIIRIPNRKSWQIQKVGFCSFINYRVIGNVIDNPELLEVEDE